MAEWELRFCLQVWTVDIGHWLCPSYVGISYGPHRSLEQSRYPPPPKLITGGTNDCPVWLAESNGIAHYARRDVQPLDADECCWISCLAMLINREGSTSSKADLSPLCSFRFKTFGLVFVVSKCACKGGLHVGTVSCTL